MTPTKRQIASVALSMLMDVLKGMTKLDWLILAGPAAFTVIHAWQGNWAASIWALTALVAIAVSQLTSFAFNQTVKMAKAATNQMKMMEIALDGLIAKITKLNQHDREIMGIKVETIKPPTTH